MACEWIMDGISFQKIYGLCGLKGHIVEIRGGVTLVDGRTDGRTTECEDRARILETEFAINTDMTTGLPSFPPLHPLHIY